MEFPSGPGDNSFRRMASQITDPAILATLENNQKLIAEVDAQRRTQKKNARAFGKTSGATSMGGDVLAAVPRIYDPTEYWEFSQLPWDISKDDHRLRLYTWMNMFYKTHYLIPILIDIFTRFPLAGIELKCPKDQKIADWYTELFLQDLDYEQFLVDLGRDYWLLGSAYPLGTFNETLGIWEHEELLDPALVRVQHIPIIGTTQMHVVPHPLLVDIAKKQEPREAWWKLKTDFPELIPYLVQNKPYPIDSSLLKQVAFKASPRDTYGTPILLRGLRTLIHEEKLMASQDAIAERLYSPMIVAKLGSPDLGDGEGPWIPTQDELAAFRDDIDIALSSDFRLLVHHFAIDIQNVFGREQMPRLDQDFDRIERRICQQFGVNPSLLGGGVNSQPYASSALQAEFLNQILRTFQNYLKRHFKNRMEAVAEAQGHWDYEKKGDSRIPIMQEVLEYDEEGNAHVVEKHKLLTPDVSLKVLDMRDEATQRNFQQQLKQEGVPLSFTTMAGGNGYDFTDELNRTEEETVAITVAQQEAKVKAYKILQAKGLPIPPDLKAEIEGMQQAAPGAPGMAGGGMPPPNTVDSPIPGGDGILMPPPPEMGGGGIGGPGDALSQGTPPGAQPYPPGPRGTVPEVSNERTPLMNPSGLTSPGGPNAGRPMSLSHTDTKTLRVHWSHDDNDPNVPEKEVEVPAQVVSKYEEGGDPREVEDWLSDEYGYTVDEWQIL